MSNYALQLNGAANSGADFTAGPFVSNILPCTVGGFVTMDAGVADQIFWHYRPSAGGTTQLECGQVSTGTDHSLIMYGSPTAITMKFPLTLGVWYSFFCVYRPAEAEFYVQLAGSRNLIQHGHLFETITQVTPNRITVGFEHITSGTDQGWWNGKLAGFRQWTAALTQSEILRESLSIRAVRRKNLYAEWRLSGPSDGLVDRSGNGHNLTSKGGTLTSVPGPFNVG